MTKKSKHKLQKTQKQQQIQKDNQDNKENNEVFSEIDHLAQKINYSDAFFIIAKEAGYFVIGTVVPVKVRIEKSGNIFQPFGKNIVQDFPVYFPLVFDQEAANNADMIYGFNEHEIPILHLSKEQMQLNQYEITKILSDYTNKAFAF